MVQLDKDLASGKEVVNTSALIINDKKDTSVKPNTVSPPPMAELKELEKFSQAIIKQMVNEGVPLIPINFQIYFDKLLETKTPLFKKRVSELMELEKVDNAEHMANIEKDVKKGFGKIKAMLQAIATIYKNVNVMKVLIKKRLKELEENSDTLTTQNVINVLNDDLNRLNILMERHLNLLKNDYEEVGGALRSVESNAIFDNRYEVYNKKYLLKSLESEMEGIVKYGYNATLMLLRVKDGILGIIPSPKDRAVLQRNISKLLLKTSRRSDIVAHFGDGVFAMLMKHTNLESAKRACERIVDLIYATSFFISDIELDIDVEISIIELKNDKTVAQSISLALDALPLSGKDTKPYIAIR